MEKEQQRREQLTKILALTSEEQGKVGQLYTTLQTGRQRVLEEMRAGVKNAEQADDEIDNLRDETEKSVRTLLGEPRMKQYRDANRAARRRERGGDEAGQSPAPAAGPGAAPTTAPPAVAAPAP